MFSIKSRDDRIVLEIIGRPLGRTWHKGTVDDSPVWKIGPAQVPVTLPIGVKVMKHREVKILVHFVKGAKRDPITGNFTNLKPPVIQVSAQQIKDKLYEIFSPQSNLLVKKEWDKAEEWFSIEETAGRISP